MGDIKFPGVFVEEISTRSKPIDGVPTSTTGFVGITAYGPGAPTLVGSFHEFVQAFGDLTDPGESTLPHAVRGFFENGGRRAWIARVTGHGLLDYIGDAASDAPRGLASLGAIEDIPVIVVPDEWRDPALRAALMEHCELHGRFAVLSMPFGTTVDPAPVIPRRSAHAALYEPWLLVPAADGAPVYVPPCGHVAGVYSRVDLERGTHAAPANQSLEGLVVDDARLPSLAYALSNADATNRTPLGINAIRHFPGRGNLVWGARTLSDNPEWKYVNVRRYLTYLEHSIERGIQWAVFEPNDQRLWANVRVAIEDFLLTCWRSGALQGVKFEEAAFVRCGRDTMTQDDLDHGRLVCLVGVAMLRPAEFVLVRIGSQTADSNDDDP